MFEKLNDFLYPRIISPISAQNCELSHRICMTAFDGLSRLPPKIIRQIDQEFSVPETRPPIEVMGLRFDWPGIIIPEGFVKEIRGLRFIQSFGPDGITLGTFTPEGRQGNPQTRRYTIDGKTETYRRIERDSNGNVNNWMNFPNPGIVASLENFDREKRLHPSLPPMGISIVESPNSRTLEDKNKDITFCLEAVYPHHPDWISYDPSCPNGILSPEELSTKMETAKNTITHFSQIGKELSLKYGYKIPLVVKLSPDMNDQETVKIIELILFLGIDGVVATNTTTDRSGNYPICKIPTGGLSGPILYPKSLEMVKKIREIEPNSQRLSIIGCGGIDNPDKVQEMWDSGADLIGIFSAFVHRGPYFFKQLKRSLSEQT
jgi:dihydroorotate dehydrogenase